MSICKDCADAGDGNRLLVDYDCPQEQFPYPVDCGCPCMKKEALQWQKMYSCPQPE